MNTLLWILQSILALIIFFAGFLKLSNSKNDLKLKGDGKMDWVDDLSANTIKMIGSLEVLAALGLILPLLLNTLPSLTPFAAIGIILTMIGAIALHLKRKDGTKAIIPNIVILLISLFIVYGRFSLIKF